MARKPVCIDGTKVHLYVKVKGPGRKSHLLEITCQICGRSWTQHPQMIPVGNSGGIDVSDLADILRYTRVGTSPVEEARGSGHLSRSEIYERSKLYEQNKDQIIAIYRSTKRKYPKAPYKRTVEKLRKLGIPMEPTTLMNVLVRWNIRKRRTK